MTEDYKDKMLNNIVAKGYDIDAVETKDDFTILMTRWLHPKGKTPTNRQIDALYPRVKGMYVRLDVNVNMKYSFSEREINYIRTKYKDRSIRNLYVQRATGKKKVMLRSKKTGRIIGWLND